MKRGMKIEFSRVISRVNTLGNYFLIVAGRDRVLIGRELDNCARTGQREPEIVSTSAGGKNEAR